MEEEILKLVYIYSTGSKMADFDFVYKVFTILASYNDVNGYLDNIEMSNYASDVAGTYNVFEKKVTINIKAILDSYVDRAEKFNFNKLESYYFLNLQVLLSIMHEFEHVLQQKKLYDKNESLEKTLIYYGKAFSTPSIYHDVFGTVNKSYLYDKLYNYNPIERMAEIKSMDNITKIFYYESKLSRAVKNYFKKASLAYKINGYIDLESNRILYPTYKYFTAINKRDAWRSLDVYSPISAISKYKALSHYSLEERVLYGIHVLQDELIEMQEAACKYKIRK